MIAALSTQCQGRNLEARASICTKACFPEPPTCGSGSHAEQNGPCWNCCSD
ncbi:hypothetical protein BDQ17DRAFT_1344520, partial [Cyathus striatus]